MASTRQAARISGGTLGTVRLGYGCQSRSAPANRAATASTNATAAEARVRRPSPSRAAGSQRLRRPEPKARASIASASCSEFSIAVRMTGTRISRHSVGPRERRPRSCCASITPAALRRMAGTRLRAVATTIALRSRPVGKASSSSWGASTSDSGATARIAATRPSPVEMPKAADSIVIGPPRIGIPSGSDTMTSRPTWARRRFRTVAAAPARVTPRRTGRSERPGGAWVSSRSSEMTAMRARTSGFVPPRATTSATADQAAWARPFIDPSGATVIWPRRLRQRQRPE